MEEELLKKEKYTHEQRLEIAENIRKLREEEAAEERKLLDMKIKQWEREDEGTDTSRESMAERNRLIAERMALDQKVIESTKKHTATIDRLNKSLADEAQQRSGSAGKDRTTESGCESRKSLKSDLEGWKTF